MKHLIAISAAFVMGVMVASSAGAEDAKKLEWLFVHTAKTAEMTSETTLVMPVEREIFAFTDRPNRKHGYMTAKWFVGMWGDDKGDSFKADPPNAVLTWTDGDTVREQELVITNATAAADSKSVVYEVEFEAGRKADKVLKNASLFIDDYFSDLHWP